MRALLIALLIAPAAALQLRPLPRRTAVAAAASCVLLGALPTCAKEAPPTLHDMNVQGRTDKAADAVLRQTSFEDLVMKTKARQEEALGRPLTQEEVAAIAAKVRQLLGQ